MQSTVKNLENILVFLQFSILSYKFSFVYCQHIFYLRCAYKVLVGKLEGKRPLARPMYVWKDNGKLDLQEID